MNLNLKHNALHSGFERQKQTRTRNKPTNNIIWFTAKCTPISCIYLQVQFLDQIPRQGKDCVQGKA